jgi:hypothetical protein
MLQISYQGIRYYVYLYFIIYSHYKIIILCYAPFFIVHTDKILSYKKYGVY